MAKIPVIKTVNLTKSFMLGNQEVVALNGVTIEIYSGELVALFGPSGCGKSTLMSMIAGLQKPSSGKVIIRGENLADLDKNGLSKHRRSKIGLVFQTYNLITTMNVVENIALPLAFGGISKSQRMQRARNLLEVVNMGKYKDHKPIELSGGQQQRIAIARSLVTNPWIILADEPTGNLDSKSANDVMRLLISLNKKSKRTVVLITHNPDYLEYVDRIFYLRDGKVIKIKVNPTTKSRDLNSLEKDFMSKQNPTEPLSEDGYEEQAKSEVGRLSKEAGEDPEQDKTSDDKENKTTEETAESDFYSESEEIIEDTEETEKKEKSKLKPIALKGGKKK